MSETKELDENRLWYRVTLLLVVAFIVLVSSIFGYLSYTEKVMTQAKVELVKAGASAVEVGCLFRRRR